MSHGPHRFRQAELTRAIKAARDAGAKNAIVEVSTDGRIRVILGGEHAQEINEWDLKYGTGQSTKRQGAS
jgi:hypothetical protein